MQNALGDWGFFLELREISVFFNQNTRYIEPLRIVHVIHSAVPKVETPSEYPG